MGGSSVIFAAVSFSGIAVGNFGVRVDFTQDARQNKQRDKHDKHVNRYKTTKHTGIEMAIDECNILFSYIFRMVLSWYKTQSE